MLRLKLALSKTLLNMEARRMAQVRSAAGPLQHHFNIHDPLQSGGNTGKTAALCHAGASCYDTEEWERRMMPCEQPSSKSDETENPNDETEAYCHDEASREDKDTGTSRSSSHPFLQECERRMMPCEQPSSKSDETEAYCHDEASREDKDTGTSRSSSHPLLQECERRMMPCEQPSSKSDETEAYCHNEASREDKDTGTSRSSSHPLLHYSTSIGGAVCSRSIKMDFVQADDALSEIAETRGPVTDTTRQDGFVMLSMLLEDHDLLETLPSMSLELQELEERSGPVCRS